MWPSIIQYVVNLLAGCFLFVLLAAYMSVAAGVTAFGLLLVVTPLILGGFCSSLALFAPKVSAILGILCTTPFLYAGIEQIIDPGPAPFPAMFIIPAALAAFASVMSLLCSTRSVWSIQKSIVGKTLVTVFAVLPALFSTYSLIHIASFFFGYV